MPNIREYTNKISGLQPSDRGVQAAINAGRAEAQAVNAFGEAVGTGIKEAGTAWVKVKENEEVSLFLKTQAEAQAGLSTAWQNFAKTADPNDPTVAARFREEQLEPILQELTLGFQTEQGKKYAEASIAQMRQHFFEKTAADQASMAGFAAVKNLDDTQIALSNAVMADPTSLDLTLGVVDTAVEAVIARNPNLTVAQQSQLRLDLRNKMRTEVATSAFTGMARGNPDEAMKALAGGWGSAILDGTERNRLYGLAASYKDAQEQDARAAVATQKAAQKDDFEAKTATLSAAMWDPRTGTPRLPPNFGQTLVELSQHPGADAGAINALRNAAASAVQDEINGTYRFTDNATWTTLASRVGEPPGSPNALTTTQVDQAYAAGKLAAVDYRFLRQAVTPEGRGNAVANAAMSRLNKNLELIKPLIAKSTMYSIDQTGTANYQAFFKDTYDAFNSLVAQGKTPSEAVDILTDPRDPRGLQQRMGPYQVGNKQAMQNMRSRFAAEGGPTGPTTVPAPGGVAPRQPGETAAQYLARTK